MTSIPVVLASILLSAGVGSGISGAWEARVGRKIGISFAMLALLTLVASTVLTRAAGAILRLPLGGRVGVVVAAIAPIGIVLGIFFPAALDELRARGPAFVPWAWGINGCLSVYGSVVAILVAMVYGFNVTLALGGLVYAGGFLAAHWFSRPSEAVVQATLAPGPALSR
jgi:hypothetical protein